MAAREQPYDPYIPSGHAAQNGGQEHAGDSRTAALQAVGLSPPAALVSPYPFQCSNLVLGGSSALGNGAIENAT